MWINIFPDKPVTQKPAETRMGSGKGNPEHWVAVVKPGRVMFELSGVPEPTAREAMRLAMHKLPIKTQLRRASGRDMSTAKELRELNDTELEHRLGEAKEELFNLRFQNATGQLDNIARLPQVRREIARIETLLREREIAAAEQHEVEQVSRGVGGGRRRSAEANVATQGP